MYFLIEVCNVMNTQRLTLEEIAYQFREVCCSNRISLETEIRSCRLTLKTYEGKPAHEKFAGKIQTLY